MENNFFDIFSYILMYVYFFISLRFLIITWGLGKNRTFIYTGTYLINFIIFSLIPWVFNLVQLWFTSDLKISPSLSLSFIVMKLFANFNLMMFALRMVHIPKTVFRTLNLIIFIVGYGCLLLPPTMPIPRIEWQPHTLEMRPIHVLFGLSAMPDTFVIFNTVLFLVYLVFYLITYFIVIKHTAWSKDNVGSLGLPVVYNIVQLLTVNIFINGISMIPSLQNSYFLLSSIWILYIIVSLNCFECIIRYTKAGQLFLRD